MRILIVASWVYDKYSPRALRTYELTYELLRMGHEVTLVCHTKRELTEKEKSKNLYIIDLGSVWDPLFSFDSGYRIIRKFASVSNRILNYFFEYPNIKYFFQVRRIFLKRKFKDFDLLVSIAQPYPLHWGVASVQSHLNIAKKWYADCGDPYAGLKNDTLRPIFYFRAMERWFMRKTDRIIVPIEEAKNAYYPEFTGKILIIPQGLSFPIDVSQSQNVSKEINDKTTVRIGYAGNITAYTKRAKHFFNVIQEEFLNCEFLIFSDKQNFFRDNFSPELLNKLIIYPRTNRNDMLKELSQVDFLLYFPYEKPGQQPFKLIDYTYLGKPILEYKADLESLENLKLFLEGNYCNAHKGVNLNEHRIENVAKQFIDNYKRDMGLLLM